MKTKRFAALFTVAALVLGLALAGCSNANTRMYDRSYNEDYYNSSGSYGGSVSRIPDMMDDIMDDITGQDRLPNSSGNTWNNGNSGNYNGSGRYGSSANPGSSRSYSGSSGSSRSYSSSSGSSGSSRSGSSARTAMGTDFGGIGALSAKGLDWGPGGPRDEKNRSQGAVLYNQKFGKYDALFLAEDKPVVYMTFDEGYENGLTPDFLDTLKEKGVKGLFFITYDFADREPELVRRIIGEGHVLGNHSWSHKNYSTLTAKQAAEDLMKMHDYIKENFDYEMKYFRFPSGNFNEQTLAVVQSMGYKSIFWSYAYKDWLTDDQPDPVSSEDKLVKAVCPGNIYLLHAVSTTNAQIMGSFIDRVRAEGYEWGDPSEL